MLRAAAFPRDLSWVFNVNNPKFSRNLIAIGVGGTLAVIGLYALLRSAGVASSWTVTLFGVPAEVSVLTLIMCLFFWLDGDYYIRTYQIGLANHRYFVASGIVMVAVVASVVIHEFAHALVANSFGNPIGSAGISWWGAFVAPEKTLSAMAPMEQVLVALAGPTANLLIGLAAVLLVKLRGECLFENSMQYLASISIKLWRFNMIPLIVLDGGKAVDGILRLFVSSQGTRLVLMMLIWALTIVMYRKYRKTHISLEDRLVTM